MEWFAGLIGLVFGMLLYRALIYLQVLHTCPTGSVSITNVTCINGDADLQIDFTTNIVLPERVCEIRAGTYDSSGAVPDFGSVPTTSGTSSPVIVPNTSGDNRAVVYALIGSPTTASSWPIPCSSSGSGSSGGQSPGEGDAVLP